MMSITWDDNQLVSMVTHLEKEIPLSLGSLSVVSADIPENSFAGKVVVADKKFKVYLGLNESMADGIVNIVMGYILSLAYEESGWETELSADIIEAAHKRVCDVMGTQNPEFADALSEMGDMLLQWYRAASGEILDDEQFTAIYSEDDMTMGLFSPEDKDTDYGSN